MASHRRASRSGKRSCYVLERSIQPGGARRGELIVCADLRVIRRALERELLTESGEERGLAATLLLSGQRITLWVIEAGRLVDGVDLRPAITLAIADGGRRSIPAAIDALRGGELPSLHDLDPDALRFELDWDAITQQVPALRGTVLARGEALARELAGDAILGEGSYLAGMKTLRLGVYDREHGPDGPLELAPGDDPFYEDEASANAAPVAADAEEAEQLAAIVRAPLDDAPRERYAAILEAKGDPRGELIRLQLERARGTLTKADARREKALLKEHYQRWAAPIPLAIASYGPGVPAALGPHALEVPVARMRGMWFERGFVVAVPGLAAPVREPALLTHPVWGTVRHLAYTEMVSSSMTALTSVAGPVELLFELHRLDHVLERLHVLGFYPPVPHLPPGACRVRQLRIELTSAVSIPEWLEQLKVASPSLETLVFAVPDRTRLADVWDWSRLDGEWLTRLEITGKEDGGRFVLERRDGAWAAASYRSSNDRSDAWYGVEDALAVLAKRRLESLEISFGARFEDSYLEAVRARCSAVAARLSLTMPEG